jgi:hypothetical protein
MARREASFFRGSELPRLLVLVALLAGGLAWFWGNARRGPVPAPAAVVVGERPKPVQPDRSVEFESVTDQTAMTFRDNAAYALLLERARDRTPADLAGESRRDVLLTHLWERPERYRGVPIHLDGTALRVLRYESKLSRTGWLYEAWISTPDSGRFPYACVFESPPKGFPIGANLSERVVFNGYFLKILGYRAADVARGAPLLVGRIGWDPSLSPRNDAVGSGSTLKWTLILLAVMIGISFVRWVATLGGVMGRRGRTSTAFTAPTDQIDPATLEQWVRDAGEGEGEGEEPTPAGPRARADAVEPFENAP